MKSGEPTRNGSGELSLEHQSETDWDHVRSLSEADVEAAVASDPDEAGMVIDWTATKVGGPDRKASMTMRVDPDVLAFFKGTGRGWQTRINAVLRSYMDHHRV